MGVLQHGHGVVTLSLLTKDELRNTTLTHGTGKRVQGRLHHTGRANFAGRHQRRRHTQIHVRLFRLACDLWAEAQPQALPLQRLCSSRRNGQKRGRALASRAFALGLAVDVLAKTLLVLLPIARPCYCICCVTCRACCPRVLVSALMCYPC